MSLDLIKKYKIKAKKSLWQNFLVNEEILNEISSVLCISWKNIIEVWPWYWALTEKILLKSPSNLVLVELDSEMVNILNNRIDKKEFENISKLSIKNIDVLKFKPEFDEYFVIANIPYMI